MGLHLTVATLLCDREWYVNLSGPRFLCAVSVKLSLTKPSTEGHPDSRCKSSLRSLNLCPEPAPTQAGTGGGQEGVGVPEEEAFPSRGAHSKI